MPAIEITNLEAIGRGIERPEQVLVTWDGLVYASDKASAVALVRRNGELQRIGHAGGEPNGIAMRADGSILIANFGLGALQELDPAIGVIRTLLRDSVGEHSLNGSTTSWWIRPARSGYRSARGTPICGTPWPTGLPTATSCA